MRYFFPVASLSICFPLKMIKLSSAVFELAQCLSITVNIN